MNLIYTNKILLLIFCRHKILKISKYRGLAVGNVLHNFNLTLRLKWFAV